MIQGPVSQTQDAGSRIHDPGCWIQDPGSSILDPGSSIQDPGSWIQDSGSVIQDPESSPAPGPRLTATRPPNTSNASCKAGLTLRHCLFHGNLHEDPADLLVTLADTSNLSEKITPGSQTQIGEIFELTHPQEGTTAQARIIPGA